MVEFGDFKGNGLGMNKIKLNKAYIRVLIVGVISSGCSPAVFAQDLSEDLFFGDMPVVLTATRIRQPIKNAPASITVIDRDMIDASGAQVIPDILRLVPGFQVGIVTGSKYTASYHGVADQFARDMQVLIDGRSVYDPAHGGVAWADLPLTIDDIQRIEVIRGPNAAAYGSNSFAGVVNIITEHPASQQGVTTKLVLGQNRTRNVVARFADKVDNLDYRLSVNYKDGDGYTNLHDSFDTRMIDFRGDYTLSDSDNVLIKLGYTNGLREEGIEADPFQPVRSLDSEMHYQQLRWSRQLAPDSELSIQLYHNYQLNGDYYELPSPYSGIWIGLSHFQSHRTDLEMQHNLTLGDDWKIAWGVGARQDKGKSHWLMGSDDWITRNQLRTFANIEKPITEYLTLNLGGMVEKFEDKDSLFSPRLALNFHIDDHHTIRFGTSRAYRMPTLVDQYADVRLYDSSMNIAVVGVPLPPFYQTVDNLVPQKIQSYEIGYIGTFPEFGLTLDGKLFREEISDVISGAQLTNRIIPFLYDNFQFINGGYYNLSGYELEFNWKPSPAVLIHAGFSHIDFSGATQDFVEGGLVTTPSSAEPVSKHMFNLLGSYRFDDGLKVSAAYYRTAEMEWNGDGDPVPDTTRANLKFSKAFRLDGSEGEASVTLESIGIDEHDFRTRNIPDTRVYLQAKLNWN
ncbi:MAG: TonB-dependent receptor [Candidatus Sedimenticola sp. 6PFRAG7]